MEFNIFDDDFLYDGYQLFGMAGWLTALPVYAPPELKKNIAAGLIATTGYSSLDYVKKKYLNDKNFENDEVTEKYQILLDANKCVKTFYQETLRQLYELKELPDSFGIYVAGAALKRLDSSFKLARFSLIEGFRFETMCIVKLIIEQSTWSYAVHNLPDDKVNDIQPTKTINSFKKINPDIGKIYGSVNDVSHVSTKRIREIIKVTDEATFIRLKDFDWSLFGVIDLLRATDIFCTTFEVIFREYLNEFRFIQSADSLQLKPNREIQVQFEELKQRIISYYEQNTDEFN